MIFHYLLQFWVCLVLSIRNIFNSRTNWQQFWSYSSISKPLTSSRSRLMQKSSKLFWKSLSKNTIMYIGFQFLQLYYLFQYKRAIRFAKLHLTAKCQMLNVYFHLPMRILLILDAQWIKLVKLKDGAPQKLMKMDYICMIKRTMDFVARIVQYTLQQVSIFFFKSIALIIQF